MTDTARWEVIVDFGSDDNARLTWFNNGASHPPRVTVPVDRLHYLFGLEI
jgi:hypothetical protein